jgi:hypothetical protein
LECGDCSRFVIQKRRPVAALQMAGNDIHPCMHIAEFFFAANWAPLKHPSRCRTVTYASEYPEPGICVYARQPLPTHIPRSNFVPRRRTDLPLHPVGWTSRSFLPRNDRTPLFFTPQPACQRSTQSPANYTHPSTTVNKATTSCGPTPADLLPVVVGPQVEGVRLKPRSLGTQSSEARRAGKK